MRPFTWRPCASSAAWRVRSESFPCSISTAGSRRTLSPHCARSAREGLNATVQTVPYEFVKGANEMLAIGR